MDAEYGEVETSGNIAGKSFYDFRLLDAVLPLRRDYRPRRLRVHV